MTNRVEQILVPDLGGAEHVSVIEVLVKPGDVVTKEQSLVTLEGEKATMDVPSPFAGTIKSVQVKAGDQIGEGKPIVTIEIGEAESAAKKEAPAKAEKEIKEKKETKEVKAAPSPAERVVENPAEFDEGFGTSIHAGPGVRRIAREFGVNLLKIQGTAPKGRILKEDVQQYVKKQLRIAEGHATGFAMAPAPVIDFSKFGEIEKQALSKIKKISGANLSRNWVSIPHVTQFGEADITELEEFRKSQKEAAAKEGARLTPLVFVMKAVVAALKQFPHFNASLDASGENLILKKYFHMGVAVDTPNGLVVPVIRNVDCKGIFELAKELAEISEKARTKGLSIADMQGSCFSISSLGGIGGTAFTPIINAPEVAILGISRMQWKAVWQNANESKTRLMLPLSLSYDHRVIDGADGARFITYLTEHLSEIRSLLL